MGSPLFFFFKKAKFQNQVCARTSTTGLQTRLSVLSHNLLKHSPLPSLVFPFPFSGVFIHPFKIHLKALLSSTDSLQLKMSQTGYDPNNPPCSHPGSVAPGYAPGYPHSGAPQHGFHGMVQQRAAAVHEKHGMKKTAYMDKMQQKAAQKHAKTEQKHAYKAQKMQMKQGFQEEKARSVGAAPAGDPYGQFKAQKQDMKYMAKQQKIDAKVSHKIDKKMYKLDKKEAKKVNKFEKKANKLAVKTGSMSSMGGAAAPY